MKGGDIAEIATKIAPRQGEAHTKPTSFNAISPENAIYSCKSKAMEQSDFDITAKEDVTSEQWQRIDLMNRHFYRHGACNRPDINVATNGWIWLAYFG